MEEKLGQPPIKIVKRVPVKREQGNILVLQIPAPSSIETRLASKGMTEPPKQLIQPPYNATMVQKWQKLK